MRGRTWVKPRVSHPAQPLSSYHIDALASRLSSDTKDICPDNSTTPPIEEIHGLNLPPVEETYNLNPLPIEETHGLDNPTQVVKVNSLYRYDKALIPFCRGIVMADVLSVRT